MKKLVQGGVAVLTVSSVGLAAMAAQGAFRAYYANDEIGRNVVTIFSNAPLETMLTRTSNVTAEVHVNPENALDNPKARFVLDMASLDTGIGKRNEIMRSAQWLDTEKYPKAVFTLTKLINLPTDVPRDVQKLESDKKSLFWAEGTMQMHGATKQIQASIEVTPITANADTATRLKGDLMRITATFPITLSDYGIIVPAPAKLKIADEEQVTVNVFASTESKPPTEAATLAEVGQVTTGVKTMANGLIIEDVKVGDGAEATVGQQVTVHYRGTFPDGRVFDESYKRGQPFDFKLGAGQVIKGWDLGVAGMKVGGKRKLTIPPDLAYGARGAGGAIPPNATLLFEVELLAVG